MNQKPQNIGVVITTYNSPLWLTHVLTGYENQQDSDFTTIVADDGSDEQTAVVIEQFRQRGRLRLEHVWHEDQGFRKCTILNKAIAETDCDYLIFTDGDCIPRADFIGVHRALAEPGCFLSGGYIKLTMPVSEQITEHHIEQGVIFDADWLVSQGQPRSHKLWKLTRSPFKRRLLNALTPTRATWNGMNASTWREDLVAVNGFNEDMQYGGLDRELGERLWNRGLRSRQIRYSAVCLHLDHARGYAKPEIWAKNNAIRAEVKRSGVSWTPNGILKEQP
ncbi:glycosyltransferase [Natronospirillum operosum]|uniref:Glycosyltransferase n=1 Tax=Natronospirillum operosum TaxID=2759953 RepID=A0A4Z0WHK7_9GAMM|nr:glycosyltransferase family 2 protein [Natronospirillum operosum]TGG95266.1 glycosyltransferase [Natronospirillum operosum]